MPLTVANRIFGGDSKSRLFSRIRVKEGSSYSAGTLFNVGTGERFSSIIFQATANPAKVSSVKTAFGEELKRALN